MLSALRSFIEVSDIKDGFISSHIYDDLFFMCGSLRFESCYRDEFQIVVVLRMMGLGLDLDLLLWDVVG
nr:hypothetical protein [Tanacetum cinerariifolium]